MRENLLIFCLAVFVGLSFLLFLKNREIKIQNQRNLENATHRINETAMQSNKFWMHPFRAIEGDNGHEVSFDDKNFGVLIVFNEETGCGSCLQLEATDWQNFLKQDSMAEKVWIKLICTVSDVKRKRQEFESMHIEFPVFYDTFATFVKDLNIQWSPRIFFLYKGRIIGDYIAEMYNREKSKVMMEKFKAFVSLD